MRSVLRFVAGLLAVVMLSGGPWFMLQTVAWARMIVTYSSVDSLGNALRKTFDGQHPCKLCLQIRKGQQDEQKQDSPPVRERTETTFELFPSAGPVTVRPAPSDIVFVLAPLTDGYSDFIESPPTPPPRLTTVMPRLTAAS